MTRPVGLLVIGQSPRPDLTDPVQALLPSVPVHQAGALDGLSVHDLSAVGHEDYPLSTRMSTGETVIVPESFLLPRLQQAAHRLEDAGCRVLLLLCAGTFDSLHSRVPLIKPYDLALATLGSMGVRRLALFAPFEQQRHAILTRWQTAGFDCKAWTPPLPDDENSPASQARWRAWAQENRADVETQQAILIDYVGHPASVRETILSDLAMPVLDVGHLAAQALAALL